MKSCSFSRTTSTGQGAARATRSAVLPIAKCFQPVKPCVAITIRSTSSSLASSMISCVATPVRTVDFAPATPAPRASSVRARKLFFTSASSSSENAVAAGRPANVSGVSGSRTWSSAISAPRSSARRSAYEKAFFDAGEKSVGTNIFLIAIGLCPSDDPATDLGIFSPKAFGVAICDFMTLSCARSKDALRGGC